MALSVVCGEDEGGEMVGKKDDDEEREKETARCV